MDKDSFTFQKYLFSAGVIIDHTIYFFPDDENTIMKINMDNWKMEYFDKFTNRYGSFWGRADNLKAVGKTIFKLTLDGSFIEVLSIEDGMYTKIPIYIGKRIWGNYAGFEAGRNHIYIIPRWERRVIQIEAFHFKKKEINLAPEYGMKVPVKQFTQFAAVYMEGCTLWLFEAGNKQVDRLDIEKNIWIFYVLPIDIGNCADVCRGNECFYILTESNCLYIWNPKTNYCELFWKDEKYCVMARYFGKVLMIQQQKIILLPTFGDDIVSIDIQCGKCACYDGYPQDFIYLDNKNGKYTNRFEDADYYYYPMWMSNYLLKINKKSGKIIWQKLFMPLREEKFQVQIKNSRILSDDLSCYLVYLRNRGKEKGQNNNFAAEEIGCQIWEMMKETT